MRDSAITDRSRRAAAGAADADHRIDRILRAWRLQDRRSASTLTIAPAACAHFATNCTAGSSTPGLVLTMQIRGARTRSCITPAAISAATSLARNLAAGRAQQRALRHIAGFRQHAFAGRDRCHDLHDAAGDRDGIGRRDRIGAGRQGCEGIDTLRRADRAASAHRGRRRAYLRHFTAQPSRSAMSASGSARGATTSAARIYAFRIERSRSRAPRPARIA